MSALAIGDQRHPPGVQAVSRGIGLRDRQMFGIQIDADCTAPPVCNHRHVHHPGGDEDPPPPGIPLETVADGLAQIWWTGLPFRHARAYTECTQHCSATRPAPAHVHRRTGHSDQQVLPMLLCQSIGHPDPEVEGPVLGYRGDA